MQGSVHSDRKSHFGSLRTSLEKINVIIKFKEAFTKNGWIEANLNVLALRRPGLKSAR